MPRGFATRNRIKQAALELFVAKGVLGTSVRDIAALAEIAEGGLYRHYASKEDLAWKLFSENYAGLAKELGELAKAKGDLPARLRTMIHRFCQFFDEEPLLFRFLLLTQHQELPKLKSKTQSPVQVLHRLVSDARKNGEIEAGDADLLTAQVLGLILQPATFMVYGLLAPGMQRIEADILAGCLRLVGARAIEKPGEEPGRTRLRRAS
ncbi:TetR/AcrR family transcriptional regulator [Dongia rigui]|uniref:TetR/AcrR family transcriptional regulator n=1 Tax=Dongia rigui TaxID=940149 RepID=A0ABU5E4A8_9PROT|nr:TetR/AcrR family transcriptional regulator [Dongia rigui]MDY0874470.1 TetR/AcrR family transcriptional regulator [Dongia rigui]